MTKWLPYLVLVLAAAAVMPRVSAQIVQGLRVVQTPPPGLPAPWIDSQIGPATGVASVVPFNDPNGTWTITGSGSFDVATHFTYQAVSGNKEAIANFSACVLATTGKAQCSWRVQTALTPTAPFVMLGRVQDTTGDPVNASFHYRLTDGGAITYNSIVGTHPYYRLRTNAGAVTGEYSDDGALWTAIGGAPALPISGTYYVGMAVSSGDATLTTATVSNVSVTTWTPPAGVLTVVPNMPVSYGTMTRAAYGAQLGAAGCAGNPTVYRVNSVADTNTVTAHGDGTNDATFRGAVMASGPRVVVFERSGYITLTSDLFISNPCLTVAGQTAPPPGITIRGSQAGPITGTPGSGNGVPKNLLYLATHDVLLQHFRIRMGNMSCNNFLVYDYDGSHPPYNIVLSNMSLSWGEDSNLEIDRTTANGGNLDITIFRTISSEGIFQASGGAACTGGGLSQGHAYSWVGPNVAAIQNLAAHNDERNPDIMTDGGRSLYINNIVYNWGSSGAPVYLATRSGGTFWRATIVGNRWYAGTNSPATSYGMYFVVNGSFPQTAGNQIYLSDNTSSNTGYPGVTIGAIHNPPNSQLSYNPAVGSPPSGVAIPTGYTPIASAALETYLLPKVGARPIDRDAVDTRIITEVTNRTGARTSSVTYPTLAVNTRALTLPANPHTVSGSGYTNLELWLHGWSTCVETGAGSC